MTAPPAQLTARLTMAAGLQAMMHTTLDTLVSELASTLGGPVARTVLAPGLAAVADHCCPETLDDPGGQAHVRLAALYPSRQFPAPDATFSRQPAMWAATLEIGVFRCCPGMDDDGNPPPADAVTAAAIVALDDIAALGRTCQAALGSRVPVVVGAVSMLGPAGYCAGVSQTLTAAFNPACPPDMTGGP